MERPVNIRPLSPISFLERSADIFRDKTAVVHKDIRRTYGELAARSYQLADALEKIGVGDRDVVSILCPNIPQMLEAHYGVPLVGAILGAINTRLHPKEVEYIINHSGAKVLFVDAELAATIQPIRENLKSVEKIISIDDGEGTPLEGAMDYEEFLATGSPEPRENPITDETHPISINYTSGTTGDPKGVLYSHRGAYLNCLGSNLEFELTSFSNYLWTVPMFHCNGWCFTWGVTAVGATHVCLRKVDPVEIFKLVHAEKISHFCCAPLVLVGMYSHPGANDTKIDWPVRAFTGGAPPSPTVMKEMAKLGVDVHQIYGLTETYGPYTVCVWQNRFDEQGEEHRFKIKARQGVPVVTAHEMRVVREDMSDVERDGKEIGEIVMRGNIVMQAYYKDEKATAEAFRGGWFHSGDMAVWHEDGYLEIQDRSKDIIISGGENISSIEVENMLYAHPDILEVAVIGVPDDKWGEVPKAFVVPKAGKNPSAEDIIAFSRENLSHFKCPKHVEFRELPKTSTGKIKKFVLREKEWAGKEKMVQG